MLIDYVEVLREQLGRARFRNGQWERFENGEWVPWPVLKLDRLGRLGALGSIGPTKKTEAA
jgi:hypothetical protein